MPMTIANIIVGLANAYTWVIIIYCLLTWIPSDSGALGDVKRVLSMLVEPFLKPFKKLIPPIGGMVDITPIVALIVLQFIVRILLWIL